MILWQVEYYDLNTSARLVRWFHRETMAYDFYTSLPGTHQIESPIRQFVPSSKMDMAAFLNRITDV